MACNIIEAACRPSIGLSQSAAHSARAKDLAEDGAINCPVCSEPLRRERVQNAWLDIDVCGLHGTWYDRGELERVARTAQISTQDWRSTPAPSGAAVALGAGAVGAYVATDIALDVGAEVAVEGSFFLLELLFELISG